MLLIIILVFHIKVSEVLLVVLQEAALRAFYLPDEPQDYELQEVGGLQRLHSDDVLNRNGGSLKEGGDAWLLRAKPRDAEVIKVYVGRPR